MIPVGLCFLPPQTRLHTNSNRRLINNNNNSNRRPINNNNNSSNSNNKLYDRLQQRDRPLPLPHLFHPCLSLQTNQLHLHPHPLLRLQTCKPLPQPRLLQPCLQSMMYEMT